MKFSNEIGKPINIEVFEKRKKVHIKIIYIFFNGNLEVRTLYYSAIFQKNLFSIIHMAIIASCSLFMWTLKSITYSWRKHVRKGTIAISRWKKTTNQGGWKKDFAHASPYRIRWWGENLQKIVCLLSDIHATNPIMTDAFIYFLFKQYISS